MAQLYLMTGTMGDLKVQRVGLKPLAGTLGGYSWESHEVRPDDITVSELVECLEGELRKREAHSMAMLPSRIAAEVGEVVNSPVKTTRILWALTDDLLVASRTGPANRG